MSDGDLFLYKLKSREVHTLKGIRNTLLRREEEQVSLYVDDEGSIVIIKKAGVDYCWVWNLSKELSSQISEEKEPPQQQQPQEKKGFFRSNSVDRRQSFENQSEKLTSEEVGESHKRVLSDKLRGSWQKILLSDSDCVFKSKLATLLDGFDAKFVSQKLKVKQEIQLVQTKLYSLEEYFGNQFCQNLPKTDLNTVLELNQVSLKMQYLQKGGKYLEVPQRVSKVKSSISFIDFIGSPKLKAMIPRIDKHGQMLALVLNSVHLVYCKLLFINLSTKIASASTLFDFISSGDNPPFDSRGKTSLLIDDVQWTNSDAFLLIMFNSSCIAIVPRLGSNLIQIYNPTVMNISQTMVDLFEQYKIPRAFNELIVPKAIQASLQINKMSYNEKYIHVHPSEDLFLVSDGQLSFVFRLEFEPQLTSLFSKQNMSFFFLRFCISIDNLAVDPDILEKIPHLLTNKLPLFEFEKNAELDEEEEDPRQVIMTASQINPFELGQKRMETNQSFNAEFQLESEVVLLNLKHLLMGLRWNSSQPLNYQQWVITVINDVFFYYLKHSEPVYAFHTLKMGEAFCRKALYLSELEGHTDKQSKANEQKNLFKKFDIIYDLYDYHCTKEYLKLQTAEKLKVSFDMFSMIPIRMKNGIQNWRLRQSKHGPNSMNLTLSQSIFERNYLLLVYYNLIQFRNYQAANFNIVFLVFACYILQKSIDHSLHLQLKRIIEIIFRNFETKKKSDDYELFLGKSGKNFLVGPQNKLKPHMTWVTQTLEISLDHVKTIYDPEQLEIIQDVIITELEHPGEEGVERKISYLPNIYKYIFQIANLISQLQYKEAISNISDMSKVTDLSKKEINFSVGISLYLFAQSIQLQHFSSSKVKCKMTLNQFLEALNRMCIATHHSHCTNFVNANSTLINGFFQPAYFQKRQLQEAKDDLMTDMKIKNDFQLRQIVAILYFYLNELDQGTSLLDSGLENKAYRIMLLSICLRKSLTQLDHLNECLQGQEGNAFTSKLSIEQFQQRANCYQTVRKSMQFLKEFIYDFIASQEKNDEPIFQQKGLRYQLALEFIPSYASIIVKEQISFFALLKVRKILKNQLKQFAYIKRNFVLLQRTLETQNEQIEEQLRTSFPLAYQMLSYYMGSSSLFQKLKCLIHQNEQLIFVVFEELELVVTSFLGSNEGKSFIDINFGQLYLTSSFEFTKVYCSTEKGQNFIGGLIKTFSKLTKMLETLRTFSNLIETERAISNEVTLTILKGEQRKLSEQLVKDYGMGMIRLYLLKNKQFSLLEKGLNALLVLTATSFQDSESQAILEELESTDMSRACKQCFQKLVEKIKFQSEQNQAEEKRKKREETSHKELINVLNEEIKVGQITSEINKKQLQLKKELLLRCKFIRKNFGLSFDTSLYFDKCSYEQRYGNILGIDERMLNQLETMRSKQQKKPSTSEVVQKEENKASEYGIIPSYELTKILMKSRQRSGKETPNGSEKEFIKQEKVFKQVLNRKNQKAYQDQEGSYSRSQSIEFENQERKVAAVVNQTKRKNSARRQFNVSKNEQSKNLKPALKTGHKRNVLSVNPSGQGINIQNQKSVNVNQMQKQLNKHVKAPPGLPKASQSKKKVLDSSKETQITSFVQILSNFFLRKAFRDWKGKGSIPQPQQKENVEKKGFKLLFIKYDGENYTVQNAKDVLKKRGRGGGEKKVIPAVRPQVEFKAQVQGASLTEQQVQKLMKSKPFEFVRVQKEEVKTGRQ